MADWHKIFVDDMRNIGVLGEKCLGCGKFDCDSCPAGTTTAVIYSALSLPCQKRLKKIYEERNNKYGGNKEK